MRALWQTEPERLLRGHDGSSNVVDTEDSNIYGYDKVSDHSVRHRMSYLGYEPRREVTLGRISLSPVAEALRAQADAAASYAERSSGGPRVALAVRAFGAKMPARRTRTTGIRSLTRRAQPLQTTDGTDDCMKI
jgi:hypothetical protein